MYHLNWLLSYILLSTTERCRQCCSDRFAFNLKSALFSEQEDIRKVQRLHKNYPELPLSKSYEQPNSVRCQYLISHIRRTAQIEPMTAQNSITNPVFFRKYASVALSECPLVLTGQEWYLSSLSCQKLMHTKPVLTFSLEALAEWS